MSGDSSAPPTQARLRAAILDLLERRGEAKTICPSDVAREVHGASDDGWRSLMEPVRRAAALLADDGAVEVSQGGHRIDIRTARGPVRIRRAHPPADRPDVS